MALVAGARKDSRVEASPQACNQPKEIKAMRPTTIVMPPLPVYEAVDHGSDLTPFLKAEREFFLMRVEEMNADAWMDQYDRQQAFDHKQVRRT